MSQAPVIMWFRSDLRLTDNTALNAALRTGSPVISVSAKTTAVQSTSLVGINVTTMPEGDKIAQRGW